MGTDSRTATATSSKSRPSWRDRHLSQLDDEQLAEVQTYRGIDDSAASEVSTMEKTAHPATESDRAVNSAKLPKTQAGPERTHDNASRTVVERESGRERQPSAPKDHRYPGSPESRYENQNSRVRNNRDNRQFDDRMQRSPTAQQQSHERAGQQTSRDAREQTHPREYANHRNHAPSRFDTTHTPLSQAEPNSTTPSEKKGFVAKILDYKPPAVIKYGLMAIAIAVMVAVSLLKPIDNSSQSQLDSAFTRAMIGFGLARTLNGVISVAQGTEFAVQPAGVGVNFSPGEILDPINDLVERFSWVMLLATSAIGIQKILLDVSSWTGISVLLAGAGVFFLLTRLRNSAMTRMADIAGKLLLLMLLVRFLVPIGSLANDWVYRQFLQPQYEQSTAELEVASERIKEISSRQTQQHQEESSTLTDRARRLYSSMTSKFDFDGMLDDYKQSAEEVSVNAINLIVVFILQTIIFPLLFMYLVYRLFRSVVLPPRSPH